MHVSDLIERKREGQELAPEEIAELISGFTAGEVPDYQMSAWAMAVFFRGLSDLETGALTSAMRDSGSVFKYPEGTPPKVDKHSTGGIGDKVSLVLAPLLACEDVWVPMVSGRGLGITGGTLDKLESIPGFQVVLSESDAIAQLENIGVFMAGQTQDFCPADRKLYALRDVTGTVPSQPLIVASIMSKKLAESLDRLVLDVKFGSGAFMKSRTEAESLARRLCAAGEANGVKTEFLLSAMDEPLGAAVGNALEVAEAVDALHGNGPSDLMDLTLDLAASLTTCGRDALDAHIRSGRAWQKFIKLTEAQHGDALALERLTSVHKADVIQPVPAPKDGRITCYDAGIIGRAAVVLGAGRKVTTDSIDFAVGFSKVLKTGADVTQGQPLCWVHARTQSAAAVAAADVLRAVRIES
ncbi:MAG: thymidine phosphorylase [Chthoniobacterales bacterium]